MADNPLSTKAGLDVGDFKAGIAEINRSMRVMESGFKASAAAIGDWGNDMSGLEQRISFLNKAMDLQRQKVQNLKALYADQVGKTGENSAAAQEYAVKVNKATEELNKMGKELGEDQQALAKMKTGTDEAGKSVDELGNQTDAAANRMQGMKSIADGLFTALKVGIGAVLGLVGAVAGLAVGISKLVLDTATAAGELNDLSLKTGVSTTRLQELAYVGDQVGTSQESIVSSLTKLTRSMSSATEQTDDYTTKQQEAIADGKEFEGVMGDQAAAFDQLGVSVTDANGNLRDNEAVFADVIDALGQVSNEAERDALSMKIFGKSAQELNPLIKAGSKELAALAKQAHEVGAVMGEEDVQAFAEFDDVVVGLKAAFKGLMGTLAGAFLPILSKLAETLKGTFSSPEFKAGLAAAVSGIANFAGQVLTNLPQIIAAFQGLVKFVVTNIPLMVQAFVNLSNWFVNNKPIIIGALAAIAAAIGAYVYTVVIPAAAAAVTAMIPIVAAMLPVIAIVAAIGVAIGLLYAAWTNNWGGIREKVTAVWAVLEPIFSSIVAWFKTNIPAAIKVLSGYWTNTLQPAMSRVGDFLSKTLFPLIQAVAKFLGAVFGLEIKLLSAVWTNVLQPALLEVWGVIEEKVMPIFEAIAAFVQEQVTPVLETLGKIIVDVLVAAFVWLAEKIQIVIDWLYKVIDIINGIVLPDWLTGGGGANAEAMGAALARGLGAGFQREFAQMQAAMGGLTLSPAFAAAGAGRATAAARAGQGQPFIFNNYGTVQFENDSPAGIKEMLTASRF